MPIGKKYRAEHIKAGLVGYPERPDVGTILVSQETLDKIRSTFVGKPIVNFDHTDIEPEELLDFTKEEKEEIAVGVVSEAGKLDNGWDYVDLIIWDEETQRNIDERGYSVSNAYLPETSGKAGTENNIEYDDELIDAEYLHLAIVPNPRYEKAKVYANSKPKEASNMNKLFRKKVKPVKNSDEEKKKEELDNMEEMDMKGAYVQMGEEKVPLEELINAYKTNKNADDEDDSNLINADQMVEVDGEKVKVSDLMEAYSNQGDGESDEELDNAEPPTDTAAEEVVDEEAQKAYSNNKKVNSGLKNAVSNPASDPVRIPTRASRIKVGQSRYGSTVKQGAK